ncbi:MAG: FecR family protein [Rhodobacteraceae bacterium HLUCCA08]|nr:MAG: FecR family protein [Rhodobacteraceae bacterium HLUCCA08]
MMRNMILSAFAALSLALPATAQEIGTVASLDPTLRGTPPGAGTRTLAIGNAVMSGETMETGAAGRAQLLFLDQTTLSLAPSSRIVLDDFVYDPNAGGGDVGIRLTTGALRFVGGKATEDREATITTPSATIGVRGSSTLVLLQGGTTYAVFLAGERLCLTPPGGARQCTSRRGGVLSSADGYVGRVDPDFLASALARIDGTPQIGTGPRDTTGIGPDNPPDRQPVSTTGEEPDTGIFDDPVREDTDVGIFGGGEEAGTPTLGTLEQCVLEATQFNFTADELIDLFGSLSAAALEFPAVGQCL